MEYLDLFPALSLTVFARFVLTMMILVLLAYLVTGINYTIMRNLDRSELKLVQSDSVRYGILQRRISICDEAAKKAWNRALLTAIAIVLLVGVYYYTTNGSLLHPITG